MKNKSKICVCLLELLCPPYVSLDSKADIPSMHIDRLYTLDLETNILCVCVWVYVYCLTPNEQLFGYIIARISLKIDARFVQDCSAQLYFNGASTLLQKSGGRHVVSLSYIILILSQSSLVLSP
jgi:hypothetical protein